MAWLVAAILDGVLGPLGLAEAISNWFDQFQDRLDDGPAEKERRLFKRILTRCVGLLALILAIAAAVVTFLACVDASGTEVLRKMALPFAGLLAVLWVIMMFCGYRILRLEPE